MSVILGEQDVENAVEAGREGSVTEVGGKQGSRESLMSRDS